MNPVYRVQVESFGARLICGAISFVKIPHGALITVIGERQNPAFLNIRYRREILAIYAEHLGEHCDKVITRKRTVVQPIRS